MFSLSILFCLRFLVLFKILLREVGGKEVERRRSRRIVFNNEEDLIFF